MNAVFLVNPSNDASRVAVSFRFDASDRVGVYESSTIAVVDVDSQKVSWKWRDGNDPSKLQLSADGRFIAFENSIVSPGVKAFRLPDQN